MKMHGYIGQCPRKGCQHATRGESSFGKCPSHGSYRLSPLWGEHSESRPCDARCMGARGPSCSCSCGGANHGRGFVGGSYLLATPAEPTLSLF